MSMPVFTKIASVAALATVGACSCIDAPDLDVAPQQVEPAYQSADRQAQQGMDGASNYEMQQAQSEELAQQQAVTLDTDRVHFGFDSSALTPKAQSTLRTMAKYIDQNNIDRLTIEGHCDERGTREYNLALGERRAVAVKNYLSSLGVDANMTTISYGKERPANPAHNPQAWAENRRAVIELNQ